MRNLRLISTTVAILLLGAGAVSAQGTNSNETPAAPAAQQSAPPEKIAPAAKPEPMKAPEKAGQAVPTAPESANRQQAMDKAAPAGDAANVSSEANRGTGVRSKRTERHVGGRYAGYHHGPLYNSYRGNGWYHGCHRHSLMPWHWC
jgi:hypothetical protein